MFIVLGLLTAEVSYKIWLIFYRINVRFLFKGESTSVPQEHNNVQV